MLKRLNFWCCWLDDVTFCFVLFLQLWKKFRGEDKAPAHLGSSRDYNVDMMPKVFDIKSSFMCTNIRVTTTKSVMCWTSLWWRMGSLFVSLSTQMWPSTCLLKLWMGVTSSSKARYKPFHRADWRFFFCFLHFEAILTVLIIPYRFRRCQQLQWRPSNLLLWVFLRNVVLGSFSATFRNTMRRIRKHMMEWIWRELQPRSWLRKLMFYCQYLILEYLLLTV